MQVLLIWTGIIVAVALAFWAGLLVGRNNPKIADKANTLADSAVEKAKETLNNKGHGYADFIPVIWIVLIISGFAWFALSGWIVFLIRLLRGC